MALRKIGKVDENNEKWYYDEEPCKHPEHNPPMHISLENGVYEYTCPACGKRVEFVVNNPTF